MPSVLQINTGTTGSTGRIAEHINNVAAANGWTTYFAYGRSVGSCRSTLIRIGNKISNAFALFEARLLDNDGLSTRIATRQLINKIKKIKPDIIHIHNLHGYYINYKILFNYLNSTNIPIVWTLHDCWPFTGHCAHFVTVNCNRWKTGCNHCPNKKRYPASWGIDNSVHNYTLKKELFASSKNLHVITVSRWLERLTKQSFLKGCDIRVIHNGINLKVFAPQLRPKILKIKNIDISNKFIILGVATSWSKGKGFDDYLRLSYKLDDKYVLLLVGLTEEHMKKLPPNIIGLEKTESQEELARLYSVADVVTSLSYAESMGLTPVEGMACGTPCIVYDNTAQPELVSNNSGIVVPTGNIDKVYQAILEISNNSIIEISSDACIENVHLHFDMCKQNNMYLNLYRELLNVDGNIEYTK